MLKAEENYKEKYTIATYCEEIEEKTKINGWYIAAGYEDEVWNALNDNKEVINNALKIFRESRIRKQLRKSIRNSGLLLLHSQQAILMLPQ